MTRIFPVTLATVLAITCVSSNWLLAQQGQPQQAQPAQQAQPGTQQPGSQPVDPKLTERLVIEIESILPTKYADGSEEKQLVNDLAAAYLERKATRVMRVLDDLASKDMMLPPKDLILAGISFATNNALQGRNLLERVAIDFREHPGVALAFSRLALAQGRYFDALTLSEKANELAQASIYTAEVQRFYKIEAVNTMTLVEMRRNDLTRAAELAQKWAVLDPTSNDMLIASAEIQFQKAEFAKANEVLEQRSDDRKQELPSAIIMTKWFRVQSAFNRMEIWMKKAWEQNPDTPSVQLEYAGWLLRNGEYDQAETLVGKYEKSEPDSQDVVSLKGRIAFGRTRYDDAVKSFGQVYAQQPNNFENSTLLIFALLETGSKENHQQAIALAQRNYQAFPNSQLAVLCMAVAVRKAGNDEAADQLLERAARMGNILPDTAYFMAEKLNRQQRGLQAKIMLDSFMESKDTFLYRERAQQLIDSIGDSDAALPEPTSGDG